MIELIKLYHVTPAWNMTSILRSGIDPRYAIGARAASWYVDEPKIEWAIEHVRANKRAELLEIVVLEVEKPAAYFARASFDGVFMSMVVIRPQLMFPSYQWFPALLEMRV